jgi:medium-chain acyl-[acyl-carrier-protein] hydrolase
MKEQTMTISIPQALLDESPNFGATRPFRVFETDCDPNRLLLPGAAMRIAQEIAGIQCNAIGMDQDLYARTHTTWFMTRSALEWQRVPHWDEELYVRTRPRTMRRATCKRITEFYDADDQLIGLMDGRWALLDTQEKRVLRHLPDTDPVWRIPFNEEVETELDVSIPRHVEAEPLRTGYAGMSYCDYNWHVNNTHYSDIVIDALPPELTRSRTVRRMVVNYRQQIPFGTEYQLLRTQLEDGTWYVAGDQDGKHCFEATAEFFPEK